MTSTPIEVCAVIVSYQPEPAAIAALVSVVLPQVGALVIVDNASTGHWQFALGQMLSARGGALLAQPHNIGLAAAQNQGIDWARSKGYSHVLLLDQDSTPGDGMVASLLRALQDASATGKVAAVGPCFHDLRDGRTAPFVQIGFPLNRKLRCTTDLQLIACDFLISSGTLIPLRVLDQVGAMDVGLFIDNVDLEWGFRAQALGYALYGVGSATMHHRLGDDRRMLPFGGGQVVVHGPLRLYYMMRNRVLLYHMPHVPSVWKAQDLLRVMAKLFLFSVLIGPRLRNLRYMLRGMSDGLRGRQGEAPDDLSA